MNKDKFASTTDRTNMFYWQTDRPFTAKETQEIFIDRHQKFNREMAISAIEYGMQQYGKSQSQTKVVEIQDPIASGSVNLVSKAILADRTKLIFRAHPSGIKNGYFWVEKLVTEKAAKAGVPVYQTYFVYDEGKKFDFDFMLIECVKGKNIHKEMWPLPKELDQKLTEQTGKYAAMINSLKTEKFGFFNNCIAKKHDKLVGIHENCQEHFYAALENNLDYLTDTKTFTSKQRDKLEKIISKHENLLKYDDPRLIHNDIADWNQLADGDKISAMIDWDECFSGDPVMEFAAWSLFFDENRMKHFKTGYQKFSDLPDGFEEKFHLYRVRYLISKLTLRKKKLQFKESKFLKEMLNHGIKTLHEELKWYGML